MMAIVMTADQAAQPVPFELERAKVDRLHSILVDRGARWLRAKGCKLVLREFVTSQETPDVIAWRGTWGDSYLIECKTSRSDFLKDRKKPWRADPDHGMGAYRYYLCPPRMIKPEELPPLWGLLYAHQNAVTLEVGQDPKGCGSHDPYRFKVRNRHRESQVLLSALNRINMHHGTVEFDRLVHATYPSNRNKP